MKKIMFDDKYGLTKAVQEGRKTMTRRIVPDGTPLGNWDESVKMSHYKVGEVVAVAISYHTLNKMGYLAPEWLDHTCEDSAGYDNKMFVRADLMPHQIRITNVRVERLQDISDEDCIREGIFKFNLRHERYAYTVRRKIDDDKTLVEFKPFDSPRDAFAALINKISGKGTFESNPYVFVYEFELVK